MATCTVCHIHTKHRGDKPTVDESERERESVCKSVLTLQFFCLTAGWRGLPTGSQTFNPWKSSNSVRAGHTYTHACLLAYTHTHTHTQRPHCV